VSYYFVGYSAKKQGRYPNLSAIMAKGYAYHLENRFGRRYIEGLHDSQQLLIFRLVNTINREQELAGPMVISYLMGWGDTFKSHHYSPIFWSSFSHELLERFPNLQKSSQYVVLDVLRRGTHHFAVTNINNIQQRSLKLRKKK
jgi:hypothetical protein